MWETMKQGEGPCVRSTHRGRDCMFRRRRKRTKQTKKKQKKGAAKIQENKRKGESEGDEE